MTIAVDLGRKATKQTNKQTNCFFYSVGLAEACKCAVGSLYSSRSIPESRATCCFCSNVLIWKIITTITGRNVLNFITGEILVRFNRKSNVTPKGGQSHFGVNLHVFF